MEKNENTKKSSKKKAPDVKHMSKEDLKAALIKKKECDFRALKIVERLIENPVPAHWFVYSLRYINQSHLEDIVEERSIIKQCGYPICMGVINVLPKKQYAISTKTNKVYDITERKKFCSDQCYKAFIFIKEQMLTSPLWLRDKEEIPDFKLLPWTTKGIPGLEVDFGLPKVEIEPSFASVVDFAKDSLDDAPESFEEMEKDSYLEFEQEIKPTSSCHLSKNTEKLSKLKTKQAAEERITRKTIETQFSEIMAEDSKFKLSKHELKLINLSDKNRKLESEKISIESLKERLENRRKAMLKRDKELKEKSQDVATVAPDLNTNSENVLKSSDENIQENSKDAKLQIQIQNYLSEMNEKQKKTNKDQLEMSTEKVENKLTPLENTISIQDKHIDTELDRRKEIFEENKKESEPTNNTSEREVKNEEIQIFKENKEENAPTNNTNEKIVQAETNKSQHDKIQSKKTVTETIPLKHNIQKHLQNRPILSTTELAVQHVENCVTEWFTIDSLIFIRGEEKVREQVSKHSQIIQQKLNESLDASSSLFRSEAYLQLCKKIDMLEFNENRWDEKVANKQLKPLPDYRMLRAESKRLIVKVRSFYRGTMEIEEPDYSDSETEEENTDDENDRTVLPTVDKNSQNVLRRRIVYNYLNKTIPGILQSFGLTSHDMNSEIRELISTFTLTAKNIVFKPIHLNLLSVIMLKILSEKNRGLYKLMEEPTAVKYTSLLLGIYKLPDDYLINLTNRIMNIESIVNIQSRS